MNEKQDVTPPTVEEPDTLGVEKLGKIAAGAAATAAAGLATAGCSGGSSGGGALPLIPPVTVPNQPPAPPVGSTFEASRFLAQATFGARQQDIDSLMSVGYDTWLDNQFQAALTGMVGRVGFGQPPVDNRQEAFFFTTTTAIDQLRQRVAYSLGQIFVVSDEDLTGPERTVGLAHYHDRIAYFAFGNFRDLLGEVTLSPMMGEYLSMVRNEPPDPANNIRPDENYAREVMQLFTIGLVQLDMDGQETAPGGLPTYDQLDIEGLAHVFTGWNWAGSPPSWYGNHRDYFNPMEPNEAFHDQGAKTIIGGVVIPAGGLAQTDLDLALDTLFNHPNVPPFISKQLIQRLVTSNPTPAYVQRVANVFASDENGERGNLASVVRAILLDTEARNGHLDPTIPLYGKLREPLLRLTTLWRAFLATSSIGRYEYDNPQNDFEQAFQRAPTVFNFYRPEFAQPGAIAAGGSVSPEFQIFTESIAITGTNRFYDAVFNNYAFDPNQGLYDIVIHLEFERTLANNPLALTNHLDALLMGGRMSTPMQTSITNLVTDTTLTTSGVERVLEAVFMIFVSPEFAVQR